MNLTELLNIEAQTFNIENIIANFVITLLLSWIIYIVYRITYNGVAYSKNFNVSIILTALVTAMVMMVIGNNLALSLGMVGALSIVRFRAALKEPKDISFIFWGISVGLAAGTGAYNIAVIGTILIALVTIIFKFNLSGETKSYVLVIKGKLLNIDTIEATVKNMTKASKLRMSNTSSEMGEIIYEVRLGKTSEQAIIETLTAMENISVVNIVAYNGNITS